MSNTKPVPLVLSLKLLMPVDLYTNLITHIKEFNVNTSLEGGMDVDDTSFYSLGDKNGIHVNVAFHKRKWSYAVVNSNGAPNTPKTKTLACSDWVK